MLYRIQADLSFPTEAHAQAVWAVIAAQFEHAVPPAPFGLDPVSSSAMRHVCYHDQDPSIPCVNDDMLITPIP